MFIELVDSLRCVASHEDTWLVAAADRMEGRRLVEGTLGCPTCRASYAIRDGIVWLGADASASLPDDGATPPDDLDTEAVRLAALLDLREPGTRALLGGARGHLAHAMVRVTGAELLLVDPPAGVAAGEGVSIVRTGGRVPLAESSMRAAAVDAPLTAAMDAVLRVVRDRGRVVAPVGAPVPPDVAELARDARDWVAERRARASAPVQLTLVRGEGRPRA